MDNEKTNQPLKEGRITILPSVSSFERSGLGKKTVTIVSQTDDSEMKKFFENFYKVEASEETKSKIKKMVGDK